MNLPLVEAVCCSDPDVPSAHDQAEPVAPPPLAEHVSAFVEDQVRVNESPDSTLLALADNETVGGSCSSTVTSACAVALGCAL